MTILFAFLKIFLSLQPAIHRPVEAAPVLFGSHPTTEFASPSYVPNPRGRGTVDLLLSSVITLTLCVYTSIHLNIAPGSAKPMLQVSIPRFWSERTKEFGIKRATVYKFYWVIIALIAPEFVLFAAFDQWQNARALCKALKDLDQQEANLQSDSPPPAESSSTSGHSDSAALIESAEANPQTDTAPGISVRDLLRPTISASTEAKVWSDITMTSAFFIVMGGFAYRRGKVFQIPDDELKFPYLMLTPQGFLALAKEKVITPGILDHKSIADRSKADSLAKFMVCVQAFWMVLNVIARKASGLPSTLIELNVVVHVVVAVVVYSIWWDKPLAVQNPIILNPLHDLNDSQVPDISHISAEEKNFKRDKELWNLHAELLLLHPDESPLKHLDYDGIDNISTRRWACYNSNHYVQRWLTFGFHWSDDFADFSVKKLSNSNINASIPGAPGLKFEILVPEGQKTDTWSEKKKRTVSANMQLIVGALQNGFLLSPRQLLVWKTDSDRELFASYTRSDAYFISESEIFLLKQLSFYCDQIPDRSPVPAGSKSCSYARPNPANLYVEGCISDTNRSLGYGFFGALFLSLTYAACHFSAWNSHFPTLTERSLWRGSCIVIAAGIPLVTFNAGVFGIIDHYVTEENRHKYFDNRTLFIAKLLYVFNILVIFLIIAPMSLLYAAARSFIVLEAFISVRNLPLGAYDSINWIEYLPHV
jgi:hypothetical protein